MDRVERAQRRVRLLGVLGAAGGLGEALLEGDDGLEVHFRVGGASVAYSARLLGREGSPPVSALDALGAPRAWGRVGGGSPRGLWSDRHGAFGREACARGRSWCRERVSQKQPLSGFRRERRQLFLRARCVAASPVLLALALCVFLLGYKFLLLVSYCPASPL